MPRRNVRSAPWRADDLGIVVELLRQRRRPCRIKLKGATAVGEGTAPAQDDGSVDLAYDGTLVSVMASKYTGDGLRMAPRAQLDDGKMDCIFNAQKLTSRKNAVAIFADVKAGGKHMNKPAVAYYQATSLTLETPRPLLLNFDGENVGYTPLVATLKPKAFEIFVPAPAPAGAAHGAEDKV